MAATAIPVWAADKVERMPIEALKGYERNARTHSEAQINQIVASMRQWGWTIPLLVDEKRVVIAGHGRLAAAKKLGFGSVPVMVAKGWTDRQIKAYRIADNKLALNAGWDAKLLAAELQGLTDMSALVGFEEGELEALLRHEEQTTSYSKEEAQGRLADRFGAVPMTILLGTSGWWQDRKRAWLALGIKGEIGREKNLLGMSTFIRHQGRITRQRNGEVRDG